MKKIIFASFILVSLSLAGCLDTTEEITINEDGSGTIHTTSDMSAALGLAKQFGGNDADKAGLDKAIDTTFSMSSQVENDSTLTDAEKNVLKDGSMKLNMDMKEDKMIIAMNFPFSKMTDLKEIRRLSAKFMNDKVAAPGTEAMQTMPGMEDAPKPTSFDDYYETIFSNGLIVKTVNMEKYSGAKNDEYLKSMQEASAMGLTMTANYIVNLPRPATKVEGKSVKLSDDKKKLTIVATIADFFDDPANLEFRVEY